MSQRTPSDAALVAAVIVEAIVAPLVAGRMALLTQSVKLVVTASFEDMKN